MKPKLQTSLLVTVAIGLSCPMASPQPLDETSERCGGMLQFQHSTEQLQKMTGHSLTDVNLRAMNADSAFRDLSWAAEASYDLSAPAAEDYVRGLVLYQRSKVDQRHCKPETFTLALEHLLSAYRHEPKNQTLVRALVQAVFVKGENSATERPGFLVPRAREILVGLEDPCAAASLLLRDGGPENLVEPLSEICSKDLEFLSELAERVRHLPILRASVLEQARSVCSDGESCDAFLDDTVAALFECGLTDRILRRYGSRMESDPSDWSRHYAAALALSGDLAKAAERLEPAKSHPEARFSLKDARSPLRSLEKPLRELLTTGSISTGTVIESYLSEGGSKIPLLKLLAVSPLSRLQSTRAFAAVLLADALEQSIEQAESTISMLPIFGSFTDVLHEAESELRTLNVRASELARDLPGSLQFRCAHRGIDHVGPSECQGEQPEHVKNLCAVQPLDAEGACRFVFSKELTGTKALWVVCSSGGAVQRGLLGVTQRLPFDRMADGTIPGFAGFALPFSSACGFVEAGRVVVDYAQHRITYSLADVLNDADGDGLSDSVEWYLGSDAHAADTDSDGTDDATDAVPSFALNDDRAPEWTAAVVTLWSTILSPPDADTDRACDPFRGTLFIESADREVAALAAETAFRVVPIFPWQAEHDVVPQYTSAHIQIRLFGVDVDEGWAFADVIIGTYRRRIVLQKTEAEWIVAVDERVGH